MKLLDFSKIKNMGKKPQAVRTPEEAEARIELMRSWTRGPWNTLVSWLVQVLLIALPAYLYLHVFNKVKIYNRTRIKKAKLPYLFVSNHLTMFDDVFLGGLIFLPYAFKQMKLFPWHAPEEQNFFLGPIVTYFMKKARCVPLTRGHGIFQPGMRRLEELLRSENIVHIYPEGTRSRTGDINRGKVGVGRIAYLTKTNVVPCYHEGSQNLLPIGSHRLKFNQKIAVVIGEPIDMSDLYAMEEGRETYQKISDRMIESIRNLRTELHENGNGVVPLPGE